MSEEKRLCMGRDDMVCFFKSLGFRVYGGIRFGAACFRLLQ